MSFSKASILLALVVFAGCRKIEPTAVLAQGTHLPGLVHAANAPIFDTTGKPYTELVLSNGTWKIHDNGNWQTAGRTEDEIHTALKDTDHQRQILLSAEGNTVFDDIKKAVRGAARAGFPRVDFLVSTGSRDGKNHAFYLDFPLAGGADFQPQIMPFQIFLDAKGAVFAGSGAAQELMDSDPADHALPKLHSHLEIYSAAAKAAESRPICQVHADPAVNYQRVIDLFSCFHAHGIFMQFTDLNTDIETASGNIIDQQRLQDLKSKPRPPAPSDQPRPQPRPRPIEK